MVTSFPCTGCGACCRQVGRTLERFRRLPEAYPAVERAALAAFPFEPREDGSCPQLAADGSCRVYEIRPQVCRVDAMGEARGMSREATWQLAAAACTDLQIETGLPGTFRVVLPVLDPPPPTPHASHPVDGV